MHVRVHWVRVGRLGIMARPRAGDWLNDELSALRQAGVQHLVSLLTDDEVEELGLGEEGAGCADVGLSFERFAIVDRSVPPMNAATIAFVHRLRATLTAGTCLVIHCRMGLGRSAMLAAALEVLGGERCDQVLAHISTVRGFHVPDTAEQRQWVGQFGNSK